MKIAVAAAETAEGLLVPAFYEESRRLCIVETDSGRIEAVYDEPGPDGITFAERTAAHDCEAIACGRFGTAGAFEHLAGDCRESGISFGPVNYWHLIN